MPARHRLRHARVQVGAAPKPCSRVSVRFAAPHSRHAVARRRLVWGGGGKGAGEGEGEGEDTDGEWDDESSGEYSGSDDEGMCGFSGRDCQELLCQGVKPGRSSIDVMMFARLIFINWHVLMCEGILGVLDDVSAGVRVSAVLALSQVFVSFFMKSTHVNELASMPACR